MAAILGDTVAVTLAFSRRSFSWGAAWKTSREKKTAARESEIAPVGKLSKRSFRVYQDLVGIPSDRSILTDFVDTRALLCR